MMMRADLGITEIAFDEAEGLHTSEVPADTADMLDVFLRDRYGVTLADTARAYKPTGAGGFTFQHGGGYDIVDTDLLGGDGGGTRAAAFADYARQQDQGPLLRRQAQDLVDLWNDDAAYLEEVGARPGNEYARGQAAILRVAADQLHKALVTTR